jgi:nucleoid DNA-binding protein
MNEKINIQELAALLSEELKITKKEADNFLRELFYIMHEGLLRDNLLKIKDLGTFKIIDVSARDSINVRTGERVTIPAHKKLSYTADCTLNEQINLPPDTNLAEEPHPVLATEISNIQSVQPEKTLTQQEIDTFLEKKTVPVSDNKKREHVNSHKQKKKLTFRARHPLLITFMFVFLFALVFYGMYRFITTSNKKEYRTTLREFNVKAYTIGIDETDDAEKIANMQNDSIEESFFPVEPRKIRTKNGEKLTGISLREYGDENFWIYLYEANKNVIKNPDNLPPDIEIIIPDAEVYGLNKNNIQAIAKAKKLAEEVRRNIE